MFEIGPSYSGVKPDEQAMKAAGIRSGSSGARNWAEKPRPVDVFDAKGDVLAVLGGLGVAVEKAEIAAEAPDWYHPGHSGVVRLGPKSVLAHFGEIHPRVLKDMNAESPMAGFEIIFDNLPKLKERKSRTRPHLELPQFHSVERDFAFVVE